MNVTTGLKFFFPYRALNNSSGVCLVSVWNTPSTNQKTLVVCSELPHNPGASITNAAETLWPNVLEEIHRLGEKIVDPIKIEHYAIKQQGTDQVEETFDLVNIEKGKQPGWERVGSDPVEAAQKLGYPVDCLIVNQQELQVSEESLLARIETKLVTGN